MEFDPVNTLVFIALFGLVFSVKLQIFCVASYVFLLVFLG